MRYRNKRLIVAILAVLILTGAAFGQVTPPAGINGWWAGDGDAQKGTTRNLNERERGDAPRRRHES